MRKNGVITGHYHDHANIVRIVQGMSIGRKRAMRKQLERLLSINDFYTLPYASNVHERIRAIEKISSRHD